MISVCKLRFHTGGRWLAAAAVVSLLPWASVSLLVAQVADPAKVAAQAGRQQEDAEILQLIADLGSADYGTREAATEALIHLGSVAEPYVRRAAASPNLEVNTRSRRILAIVSRRSFDEAIEAFLADADEGGGLGTTLPGWERARPRLGNSSDARRLFAEMYRAEPALMAAYGQDEPTAVSTFGIRVDELHDRRTQQNQINYQLQNQLHQAISVNVMALLFVGADLSLELTPMSEMKLKMLFMQSWPPERVAAAAERDHLRDWLAQWIVHRISQPQRENEAITIGMRYDVPQTVEVALRVLKRRDEDPYVHVPMYAVLCVGKYGQAWHLPLVERYLENDTVVHNTQRRVNNQVVSFQTQLRDVALIVLLHRTDQSPEDYGFESIDRHAEYLFLSHSVAFEKPEERDEAFAKWFAWRARHAIFEGEPPLPSEIDPNAAPQEEQDAGRATPATREADNEGAPPDPSR